VFAGVLTARVGWQATALRDCAALEGLFPAVDEVLQKAGRRLLEINGYIYCEGPGSVLSLRLCAMAIETWRRLHTNKASVFKYNSLQLVAHQILADTPKQPPSLIVSDWKKGAWNALIFETGAVGDIKIIDDDALAAWTGPLYHLPQRKGWQDPPPAAKSLCYDLSCLHTLHARPGLLTQTDSVELYNAGTNTFQQWTPSRHRAPS
jgi:tRNA threonylcarbamoyladenosine biosynthesis protein TsaB